MDLLFTKLARLVLLSIFTTIVIVCFALTTYQAITLGWEVVFDWHGWTMVIGLAAVLAAAGVILLLILSLHNGYNRSLEQARFLFALGQDINQSQQKYYESSIILKNYREPPNAMSEDEWCKVVYALRKCYESTSVLYQICFLIKNGLLNIDCLYSLHYKSLTSHVVARLRLLLAWCDTGLELEAGYDLDEVKTFLKSLKELVSILEEHHLSLGGKPNCISTQEFKELELALVEYERYLNLDDSNNSSVSLNNPKEENLSLSNN